MGGKVDVGSKVFLLKFGVYLILHHPSLCARQFLFLHGGALLTKPTGFVPADLFTNPSATASALVEERLDLLDCRLQRRIVRLAAHGALDTVGRIACPTQDSTEKSPCCPPPIAHKPELVWTVRSHEALVAVVAVESKLKTLI